MKTSILPPDYPRDFSCFENVFVRFCFLTSLLRDGIPYKCNILQLFVEAFDEKLSNILKK